MAVAVGQSQANAKNYLDTEIETTTVQLSSMLAIFYGFNWSETERFQFESVVHFPKTHIGFASFVHLC